MWENVIDWIIKNSSKIFSILSFIKRLGRNPKTKIMFKQILFNLVKQAATEELKALLVKFEENNGVEKTEELKEAMRRNFVLLQDVVDDTKTKIDDTLVDIVLNALQD